MHKHFRHTWKYVIVDILGALFYWTRFISQQSSVRQYHFDLADQPALQIRVWIKVRLIVALYFSICTENNDKMLSYRRETALQDAL